MTKNQMTKNQIHLDVGAVILKAPRLIAIAEELAELYANYGGPNFLMFDVVTEDGLFTVTLQPVIPGSKSPTTVLADLNTRVKTLERLIEGELPCQPK